MNPRNMHACRLAGVIALAAASGVEAQSLNSRLSQLAYAAVYGAGGDTFTSSASVTYNTLDLAASPLMSFADARSGFVLENPDRPWSAAVDVEAAHEFSITGSIAEFSRIQASGRSEVAVAATGEGLAQMFVPSGGNQLEFTFTLGSTVSANLAGSVTLAPGYGYLSGNVILQQFNGFIFATIFSTLSLPGEQGNFNLDLELTAGEYRLIAGSDASGFAFAEGPPAVFAENSWSYDLTIVPAPASALVLAAGFLRGRRRR